MTQIEKTLSQVAERWRKQGLDLLPPASRSMLDEFESRFQVCCPNDFAQYLLALGGMPLGTEDEHLIRFWPLSEIEPDADPSNPESAYFVFADYLIWSHGYGINLSAGPSSGVFLLTGPSPKRLASSFTEFLNRYLNDVDGEFLSAPSPRP